MIITRLPVVLEQDSIRVEGETRSSSLKLTVFDVIYVPPSKTVEPSDDSSQLSQLREKIADLQAEKALLDKQESILSGWGWRGLGGASV